MSSPYARGKVQGQALKGKHGSSSSSSSSTASPSTTARAAGWLEIRKGALSFLRGDGRLFIYNVRFLAPSLSASTSSSSSSSSFFSAPTGGAAVGAGGGHGGCGVVSGHIGPHEMALMMAGDSPPSSPRALRAMETAAASARWTPPLPGVDEKSVSSNVDGTPPQSVISTNTYQSILPVSIMLTLNANLLR